jgi:hypothetical protein
VGEPSGHCREMDKKIWFQDSKEQKENQEEEIINLIKHMEKFEPIDRDKSLKIYWEGNENKLIRLWLYTLRGLSMVNEFKYLVLLIASGVALLYARIPLKWVIIVGLIAIPVALIGLIIIGKWQLKKATKVEQWVSTELGSVLKYSEYNMKVRQLEVLEEINKKLNNS